MASTYSPSLKIELIGNGDQSGTWGTTTNNNLGTLIEQAITGVQGITMANANYTLTSLNGTTDEARNAVLVVTGTNSAERSIIAPTAEKMYIVKNATTGGFDVRVKTASGTGVLVPNGITTALYCDGSEFYYANPTFSSSNTGTTLVLRDGSGNFAANVITAVGLTVSGTATGTTPTAGDNSTKFATTAFTTAAITTATGSLGTLSTQNSNSVSISGGAIANVTNGGSTSSAADALGYLGMPANSKSTGYTLVLADAGKHIYYTGGAATLTIPTNAAVAFPVGTTVTIINNGSGALTIGTTSLTVYFAGTGSTGNRTLATKGLCTVIKVATDTWFISGVGLT